MEFYEIEQERDHIESRLKKLALLDDLASINPNKKGHNDFPVEDLKINLKRINGAFLAIPTNEWLKHHYEHRNLTKEEARDAFAKITDWLSMISIYDILELNRVKAFEMISSIICLLVIVESYAGKK